MLIAGAETLTRLFGDLAHDEQLRVLCLTETARRARTHDDYLDALAATPAADAKIIALVVAGPRNRVTRRT